MTEVRDLLPAEILETVLDAYQVGLRYTYGSCAVISFLTFISTLFIESFALGSGSKRK